MKINTTFRVSLTKNISEDSIVVNDRVKVYGVFDGATPITSFLNSEGKNGAYLASNLFKSYFENNFRVDMNLPEGIIQANKNLMEEMTQHQIDTNRPEERWSTCAAIVKFDDQSVSFAQLGDCMILAEFSNGMIKILTKDTVKDISVRAKLRRKKQRAQGILLPDESYYNSIKNQLIYNKSMANTDDGYSVANGTEEVGRFIQSGYINTAYLKSNLLISDGLFHPKLDLVQTYNLIQHIGLEGYSYQLEREEHENKTHSDDKTGIHIYL